MRTATKETYEAVCDELDMPEWARTTYHHSGIIKAALHDIRNKKPCSRQRENTVRQALGMAPLKKDSRRDVRPRIDANLYNEVIAKYGNIKDALEYAMDTQ